MQQSFVSTMMYLLLQGNLNLGPEKFGQKLDRASFLTNYSGPRVGFNTYEGYF